MNHVLVEAEKNIKIAAARIDAAILYKFATSGSKYQTAARIDAAILYKFATSGSKYQTAARIDAAILYNN